MTTVLPAIALCPLNPHFEYAHCHAEHRPDVSTLSAKPLTVFTRLLYARPRDVSPASVQSSQSAPLVRNDENATPSSSTFYRHLFSSAPTVTSAEPTQQGNLDASRLNNNVSFALHKLDTSGVSGLRLQKHSQAQILVNSTPLRGFQNDTPTPAKQHGLAASTRTLQCKGSTDILDSSQESLEPFPLLSKTHSLSENEPKLVDSTESSVRQISDVPWSHEAAAQFAAHSHCQRPSNASSCFVRTIKTASMSNGSLSILPHSLKMTQSIDSHSYLGDHPRHSLDSYRPRSDSSSDEIAFMRSLKRRQVINELIMTEESYVADLKALVYLYSTLLVSATAISIGVKTAIQHNVTSLLHIHESLLSRLHQANFRAAARKWADTKSPMRLGKSNRMRVRCMGRSGGKPVKLYHLRARSSTDCANLSNSHDIHSTADPIDASDIATVFDSILQELFVYEEYCANHETITHELQKHMPSLWSTYGSGMESLNRALVALDRQEHQNRKGLTVGDLLIKPIQRICKYPLLIGDLMKQTPVIDSPGAYEILEGTLNRFRTIVQAVNIATGSHLARRQIQQKWLLQDRLNLLGTGFSPNRFRTLGNIQLCGVLHFTFQMPTSKVEGGFAVCTLFDNHFLVAMPSTKSTKFELCTIIALPDLRIESAIMGRGLQAPAALHTWKVCFTAEENLYEILLSACSKAEEDQWVNGLRGIYRPDHYLQVHTNSDESKTFMDLKSHGSAFRPNIPLSRQTSVQRAATIGNRNGVCQVILRNTNNPQDLHEYRNASLPVIGRSQSYSTANKIVVLAPKRSDRTRLEASLCDLYTKDRLPFPGMIGSKSGQIIRASAGSLVRKLSFASMHASFSKRTTSLSSKKSCDATCTAPKDPPTFIVMKHSLDDRASSRNHNIKELPEIDTMDSLIERMINGGSESKKRSSFSSAEKHIRKTAKLSRSRRASVCEVGPKDPATVFYHDKDRVEAIEKDLSDRMKENQDGAIQHSLSGSKKKRWSNPVAKLRELGSDGIRCMLNSSK